MRETAPLTPQAEQAVRELIARTASTIERIIAVVRLLTVSANMGRTLWVWESLGLAPEPLQILLLGLAWAGMTGWSLVVLVALRGRTLGLKVLTASVVLDSLFGLSALVSPLWPDPDWPGVVRVPDMAWLVISILGGGLRLWVRLAFLAGALSTLSFCVLVWVDQAVAGPPLADVGHHVVMWLLLLLTATALSAVVAWLVRQLCRAGAQQGLEAERARHGLDAVLEDHHDARTLLSSATLNADLVKRALRREPRSDGLAEVAGAVSDDLSRVNQFIGGIRERAYGELAALHAPEPVDLPAAAKRVFDELETRFAAHFAVRDGLDGARAWIAGGEPTLRRILTNLLVNACEGDGRRGAGSVEVELRRTAPDTIRIVVRDDGPGFPEAVLRSPPESRVTSKPDGSGLGLLLVETLLGPNAATLRRVNRPEGGASVSFDLPATSR